MAEVVGLVASIIAIASLAEVAIKTVKKMKSIADELETVREDLTSAVFHVRFSAVAIDAAQRTLQSYCNKQKGTDRSKVIDLIESKGPSGFGRESRSMQKQLQQLKRAVRSLRDIWTPLVAWKWRHSLKKQMEAFQIKMQVVQFSLGLILNSVLLESATTRRDRDEILIKHLKRELKTDEMIIRTLRRELQAKESVPHGRHDFTDPVPLQESFDFALILEIARAVRKTESVPPPAMPSQRIHFGASTAGGVPSRPVQTHRVWRSPPMGTAHKRPNTSDSAHSYVEVPAPGFVSGPAADDTTFTASSRSSEGSQGTSHLGEPSSVTGTIGSPGPRSGILGQHAHIRVESPEVQALRSPEPPPASRELPLASREDTHSPNPCPPPQPPPAKGEESDFIDVRPLSKILKLVSSPESQRIQGRLERLDESWESVVGIYEPDQTFNFISDALVSELDLLGKVEQYTGEEGVMWVETPSGRRIKPTGTIQIRWEWPQLRPCSLRFWVFPYHEKRSLVFGQPWAERDRYLSGRH